jgi:L-asparagine oxygenase
MTIVNLEHVDITVLKNLERRITALASENPELFCRQMKYASAQLPIHITLRLMDFAYRGSPSGFLLFDNLPKENLLPETPPGNTLKIGEKTTLAKIQSILISVIGDMIAYEAEGYGKLFQDIVPMQNMAKNQTSLGSDIELEIHTEQAFSALRPDILSLACLRGDEKAYTYILPVKSVIENLTPFEIQMLREPLWITGVDLSFKLHGKPFLEGDIRGPMPILSGPEDDPRLLFDQDLMMGTTPEADDMVKKIVEIYYKHRIAHCLQPGEIIFVDNRRAVHGRSSFSPKYDGYDRFLVRCFATMDYEKSAHARIGRTVAAMYS